MSHQKSVNLAEFPEERIIRSPQQLAERFKREGLTAFGNPRKNGPRQVVEIPKAEIFIRHMKGHSDRRIASELGVRVRELRAFMRTRRFDEEYHEFIQDSARRARLFGDYKERKSIEAFLNIADAMDRHIESDNEKEVKIGLQAAESLADRSVITQKTVRQEIKGGEPLVLTEEAIRYLDQVMKESEDYERQRMIETNVEGEELK